MREKRKDRREHDRIIHEMGMLDGEAQAMWNAEEDFAHRHAEWLERANALEPRARAAGLEGYWIELFAGGPPAVSVDVARMLKSRAELERKIASKAAA